VSGRAGRSFVAARVGSHVAVTTNHALLRAAAPSVWAVLMDPMAYSDWVVGAKKIRGADDSWPAPGARFHHTVGVGPASLDDSSKILAIDAPDRLVLEVRVRPAGIAVVELLLEGGHEAGTTRITMNEAIRDPWWLRRVGPLLGPGLHARNSLSLWRLRRLVDARR
jgi:hypothetical protein